MSRITMTYEIAHAAAWDAGNRSARKAGRTEWNDEDYDACVAEFNRLWPVKKALAAIRGMKDTKEMLATVRGTLLVEREVQCE